MKTPVVINGMPTMIKAFMKAKTGIQNDLEELEMGTERNRMPFNKGAA